MNEKKFSDFEKLQFSQSFMLLSQKYNTANVIFLDYLRKEDISNVPTVTTVSFYDKTGKLSVSGLKKFYTFVIPYSEQKEIAQLLEKRLLLPKLYPTTTACLTVVNFVNTKDGVKPFTKCFLLPKKHMSKLIGVMGANEVLRNCKATIQLKGKFIYGDDSLAITPKGRVSDIELSNLRKDAYVNARGEVIKPEGYNLVPFLQKQNGTFTYNLETRGLDWFEQNVPNLLSSTPAVKADEMFASIPF